MAREGTSEQEKARARARARERERVVGVEEVVRMGGLLVCFNARILLLLSFSASLGLPL